MSYSHNILFEAGYNSYGYGLWGSNFGVVEFKDWRIKRILWRKYVHYETLADYKEGIDWLENNGFKIEGIACDGLRGMFQMISKYRVQMC